MTKRCKCNIISFGHINIYILLIPLGAIFDAANDIIRAKSEKFGRRGMNKRQHPLIITINNALGLSLSFIPFIIYKVCNKRNKSKNNFFIEKTMTKSYITKKEKFLWILLASVLDFIAKIIYYYNWNELKDYITFYATNIILMCLFSYCLLKTKLYKHHYLSAGGIALIGTTSNIIFGISFFNILKQNYIGDLIYLFAEGIFNILYVLDKLFMVKKFIKSYAILCFQGLIELILGIIILVLSTKYFDNFDSYIYYFKDLNGKEIARFISLIFTNFFNSLIIFIVIDIFTPFHIFLLNILSKVISSFFDEEIHNHKTHMAIYITFFIASIFIVLIYMEIIQLNFCGLSFMTKKSIEERAKLDTMNSNLNIINNDENNNGSINDNINNLNHQDNDINTININSDYIIELKSINSNDIHSLELYSSVEK